MAQVSLPTLKLYIVLTTTSAVHLFSGYRLQLKLQNWMVNSVPVTARESPLEQQISISMKCFLPQTSKFQEPLKYKQPIIDPRKCSVVVMF
jgi:hypothetical protein